MKESAKQTTKIMITTMTVMMTATVILRIVTLRTATLMKIFHAKTSVTSTILKKVKTLMSFSTKKMQLTKQQLKRQIKQIKTKKLFLLKTGQISLSCLNIYKNKN